MYSVFRIGEIRQIENGIWQIKLKLTADNDPQLRRLTERMRKEIPGPTRYRIPQLMLKMGLSDQALNILKILLKNSGKEEMIIHPLLRLAYNDMENGDVALFHFRQGLSLALTVWSPDDHALAATYSNIGCVLETKGHLDEALKHHQRALEILLKRQDSEPELIAAKHILAVSSTLQDRFAEALASHEIALHIQSEQLPFTHPELGKTYANIGTSHYALGHYSAALDNQMTALSIQKS
ncbi:unnamed protein product [Didymodactylos carnosus]|uniref:Tetratricopeptide repeat protein n=1 Tax=Didymodactylos carnosus TaxID=1234261 RepID=A0A815F6M1_9BILA|nr:unnamed protein product [Didymodactylos carnosus]CAF4172831.1 unnamed protein product [Didymodactylos carnosus]